MNFDQWWATIVPNLARKPTDAAKELALLAWQDGQAQRAEGGTTVLATEKGLTTIGEVVAALQELSDMYAHTWDRVGGGLLMLDNGVARFEKAHARAENALKAFNAPPMNHGEGGK